MNFRVIFVLYDPKNIKIVYSVNRNIQSSKICCLVLSELYQAGRYAEW